MNKIASTQSIIAGVLSGIIYAAFSLGTYYSGISSFAGFTLIYTWLPVVLTIILVLGFNLRKKLGGYMGFKEVLQYALVAYLVYEIIVAIITYILFVAIDPLLTKKLFDAIMQTTMNWMKSMGTPQAKMDEAMAKAKSQPVLATTAGTVFKGIAWSLIWAFAKSLLVAFIIKKDKPAELDFNPQPVV